MQGFNMGRYVPPDLEGTTSANALHKKHPLGHRASKLASHCILTVRFEMPYPVWCLSCPKPTIIGQGVRFNAEKKRAGNYFSTPIWSFRFKHNECGGWIEMRTDPKNTAYVVVEGARKRDVGNDKEGEGAAILTDTERDELRRNAFASLEKTIADRKRLEMAADRIDDLTELSERHWSDPYALNQRLRRDFRKGRKQREKDAAKADGLRDRMGLAMELLPEAEEDARRAALVDFGMVEGDGGGDDGAAALRKPLFTKTSSTAAPAKKKEQAVEGRTQKQTSTGKQAIAASKAESRKEAFVKGVLSNTRAARDPFLVQDGNRGNDKAASLRPSSFGIVKGKRRVDGGAGDGTPPVGAHVAKESAALPAVQGLVEYDSD